MYVTSFLFWLCMQVMTFLQRLSFLFINRHYQLINNAMFCSFRVETPKALSSIKVVIFNQFPMYPLFQLTTSLKEITLDIFQTVEYYVRSIKKWHILRRRLFRKDLIKVIRTTNESDGSYQTNNLDLNFSHIGFQSFSNPFLHRPGHTDMWMGKLLLYGLELWQYPINRVLRCQHQITYISSNLLLNLRRYEKTSILLKSS